MLKVLKKVVGVMLVTLTTLSLLVAPESVLAVSTVPAPDDPPGLTVITYNAYENTKVMGDTLIILLYDIPYATLPAAPASVNFIFRYLDAYGDPLQSVVPYTYLSLGYEYGAAVFYWSSPDSSPTWGDLGSIQLTGNPTVNWAVTPPPSASFPMLSSNWQASSGLSVGRSQVCHFITSTLAVDLGDSWSTTLIAQSATGTILNNAGQTYFYGAFSEAGLNSADFNLICSSILTSTQAQPLNPPPSAVYARTYQGNLMQVWLNSILGPDIRASASSVGVNTDLWLFGTFALITIFVLGFIAVRLENPGFIPMIFIPIFVGGIKIGVVPMDIGVGACALLFILSMYLLIHRRAPV